MLDQDTMRMGDVKCIVCIIKGIFFYIFSSRTGWIFLTVPVSLHIEFTFYRQNISWKGHFISMTFNGQEILRRVPFIVRTWTVNTEQCPLYMTFIWNYIVLNFQWQDFLWYRNFSFWNNFDSFIKRPIYLVKLYSWSNSWSSGPK